MAGLTIHDLKKSFGDTIVIDDISFAVADGEFCILLGPSGCGKTTVLRLIAGLEQQDAGDIFIGGQEVSNCTPKERNVAMVFQSYALYPHLNAYENMSFSLTLQKVSEDVIDKKVKEVAGLLGIEDLLYRKPKELSGGQRQRVAIGRAIVRNPSLFLFDEPLSNLDAKLRASMRIELAKLHQQLKSTIIYVTHDQIEAMTLGQKIILLNEGTIQQIGTPDDMYNRPSNLFVAGFIGTPQINLFEGTLIDMKNRLFFESRAFRIDVHDREDLKEFEGQTVTIGIRPESLILENGPIRATIELIEHLGSESILYAAIGNNRLTARLMSDVRKEAGDEVGFSLHEKGVHFFHNGERIVRP